MSVLRHLGKYAGYYVISAVLISLFVSPAFKGTMNLICGAAFATAFFADIFRLLLGDLCGDIPEHISVWCSRGAFGLVAVMSVAGIGLRSIVSIFAG